MFFLVTVLLYVLDHKARLKSKKFKKTAGASYIHALGYSLFLFII